jgi:alpha-1,2-mannosyltransferase
MLIAIECMIYCVPDYYIDTVGAPFTYPIVYILSFPCHITAYVHYPVISSDMLKNVVERRPIYNNNERITSSTYISSIKLFYYLCFATMYQFMGRFATQVVVNSKWTQYHIEELWRSSVLKIYPPCKTNIWKCCSFWIKKALKRKYVLSIGQFRQEKNHELQLRSWRLFKDIFGSRYPSTTLVMIGSTRNEADLKALLYLRKIAESLNISDSIIFVVNAPKITLNDWLNVGSIGLHTMWNEHFGISVVEMLSAGLIIIAHDSGGPSHDIIVPNNNEKVKRTGLLAATRSDYAYALGTACAILDDMESCSNNVRISMTRIHQTFSEKSFMDRIDNLSIAY